VHRCLCGCSTQMLHELQVAYGKRAPGLVRLQAAAVEQDAAHAYACVPQGWDPNSTSDLDCRPAAVITIIPRKPQRQRHRPRARPEGKEEGALL
jgi:hypothetical protein